MKKLPILLTGIPAVFFLLCCSDDDNPLPLPDELIPMTVLQVTGDGSTTKVMDFTYDLQARITKVRRFDEKGHTVENLYLPNGWIEKSIEGTENKEYQYEYNVGYVLKYENRYRPDTLWVDNGRLRRYGQYRAKEVRTVEEYDYDSDGNISRKRSYTFTMKSPAQYDLTVSEFGYDDKRGMAGSINLPPWLKFHLFLWQRQVNNVIREVTRSYRYENGNLTETGSSSFTYEYTYNDAGYPDTQTVTDSEREEEKKYKFIYLVIN